MPADSRRAVFLSYASQDAEEARRVAETLRAAGPQLWHHPAVAPRRDDPRFQALLEDPKNNAPLF